MNIALSGAVVVLLLLPGVAFRKFLFSGELAAARSQAPTVFQELAEAIVAAAPFDYIALWLLPEAGLSAIHFRDVLALLSGSLDDRTQDHLSAAISSNWKQLGLAYLLLLGVAARIGRTANRAILDWRWDVRFPSLGLTNRWFRLFYARPEKFGPDIVSIADVLCDFDRAEYRKVLYRGVVQDYEVDGAGALRTLTLAIPLIYHLPGPDESTKPTETRWRQIPSDRFVILASSILNINVTYFPLDGIEAALGVKSDQAD